jgi:uncharacterized repeat protein (TIGR04138 family)
VKRHDAAASHGLQLPESVNPVRWMFMPPSPEFKQKAPAPAPEEEEAFYPPQAYLFVQEGLDFMVRKLHGKKVPASESKSRHVSGQQLCEGLRELALARWGRLARTVLSQWNITSTMDFGQIVFSMIEAGQMQKTPRDTIEDFRNVYDFKIVFEAGYRIPSDS